VRLDQGNGTANGSPNGAVGSMIRRSSQSGRAGGIVAQRVPGPAMAEVSGVAAQVGGSDAISALRWGTRKYIGLVLACVVLVVVAVPAYLLTRPVANEATALVVAQRLDMDLVALPRFGEAVFDNGEVARTIAAKFGDGGDFEDIVPQQVSLVAEQDSIVFQVVGHDVSPTVAADKANVAAEVFAAALNGPGVGVGAFVLQDRAAPPPEPIESLPSLPIALPIGLLAGLVLGLAVVSAILIVRRPVLVAADAEAATGVPSLGAIGLPRTRRSEYPDVAETSGVVPVCRRLLSMPTRTVIFVSADESEAVRHKVLLAASYVLGRVAPVRLVVDPELQAAAEAYGEQDDEERGVPVPGAEPVPEITLIDGSQAVGLPQLTANALTLLVVPAGTSVATLRALVTAQLGGADAGRILLVDEHGRRSRTPHSARRSVAGPTRGPVDVDTAYINITGRP
jgi:hypothetical protein